MNKVEAEGARKIYGKHTLTLGELVLTAIAIIIMYAKARDSLKNKYVILALVLIILSMIIW